MTKSVHIEVDERFDIESSLMEIQDRNCNEIYKLKNAKILFTGATGFFGFWMLRTFKKLYEQGIFDGEIYAVSRNPSFFLKNFPDFQKLGFLTFIEGDVKSVSLKNIKPNHLIHFASTSANETFSQVSEIEKIDTLYLGTKNILEQVGRNLEKVLFASSGIAYGTIYETDGFFENIYSRIDSQQKNFGLSIGKIISEYQVRHYGNEFDFDYSIARCFSFAGEYMPLSIHYAFGNFIKSALKGEDLIIKGSGNEIRSYMYIADAISWFLVLLAEPKNLLINVGSDEPVSIKDLASKVSLKSNCGMQILGNDSHVGNFSRLNYVPNLDLIEKNYPVLKCWTNLSNIIDRMLVV